MQHVISKILVIFSVCLLSACSTLSLDSGSAQGISAAKHFKQKDPTLEKFFVESYAYIVFPRVERDSDSFSKAKGRGYLFEKQQFAGSVDLDQTTIGYILSAQPYSQIIFFETHQDYLNFKQDKRLPEKLVANAAGEGVARGAIYSNGAAVFTMTLGGIMYEASIVGQRFHF